MAAETGQSLPAETLIEHRANVNRENSDYRATALHIATFMGRFSKIFVLVGA